MTATPQAATRWALRGWLGGACRCDTPCPCWFEGQPTHGTCDAIGAATITEGHFEGVDLTGCTIGTAYRSQNTIWAGGITAAIYVGEEASAEQFEALSTILTGQAGGLFAALFTLIADFKGVRRTTIELVEGGRPTFQLGPVSRITITPIIGRDGVSPISVHNAKMSFGGHRNMGHTAGRFVDPELGWDWELGHADWGPINVSA